MGLNQICGVAIMKYGDELTTKLEELAISKTKSPKEWDFFKNQVLHSFMTAESIGNRSVNLEEHTKWEERLIKLGILERKNDKGEQQTFRESIRYDITSDKNGKGEEQRGGTLESALLKAAEQQYMNTGAIPLGYKKDERGKIVRIVPRIENRRTRDKLSAGNNLSTTPKKQELQGEAR